MSKQSGAENSCPSCSLWTLHTQDKTPKNYTGEGEKKMGEIQTGNNHVDGSWYKMKSKGGIGTECKLSRKQCRVRCYKMRLEAWKRRISTKATSTCWICRQRDKCEKSMTKPGKPDHHEPDHTNWLTKNNYSHTIRRMETDKLVNPKWWPPRPCLYSLERTKNTGRWGFRSHFWHHCCSSAAE